MDTSRVRELKTWPPPPLDAGLYRVDRSSRELNATFGPSSSPLCMFALLSPQHLSTLLSVASVPISPPELYLAFSSQGSSESASEMAGDHGNIHIINSSAAWDAKLEEAKNTSKIVVVDFTATWCGPCRLMSPIFTELSKKFENLVFLKVDVDEVQDVTAKWEVRAMPTFIFIKDGKLLDKIVGANKEELERKCNHYATTTVTSSA